VLRVAAVQAAPVLIDREATIARVEELVQKAVDDSAELEMAFANDLGASAQ
jgi:predicted amidohydrolase